LPGLFMGDAARFHHGLSHSLGFALAAAACVAVCAVASAALRPGIRVGRMRGLRIEAGGLPTEGPGMRTAGMVFVVLLSHGVLDFFTADHAAPFGFPAFWPFSGAMFLSPAALFLDVTKASDSGAFFRSLFVRHNLNAVWREVLVLCLPAAAAVWWAFRPATAGSGAPSSDPVSTDAAAADRTGDAG
jgi:hypothetical protein